MIPALVVCGHNSPGPGHLWRYSSATICGEVVKGSLRTCKNPRPMKASNETLIVGPGNGDINR